MDRYENLTHYAPNFKEVEGHIGLGLSVRPSVYYTLHIVKNSKR